MSNVHNYEEIKDLLFGKDRSRPLHPEDDDLDEIIAKVLQKVEIETLEWALHAEHGGQRGANEIEDRLAALRNQTGEQHDEPQSEKSIWGNRKEPAKVSKKRNNGWGR